MPHAGRAIVPMTRALKTRRRVARAGMHALRDRVQHAAGRPVKGLASAADAAGLQHTPPHRRPPGAAVRMAETGNGMEEIRS